MKKEPKDARMDLRMTQKDREAISKKSKKAGYRYEADYVKDKALGVKPSAKKLVKK